MKTWRLAALIVLGCAAAFAMAAAARHWLIEPAAMGARCLTGADDGLCLARDWIIASFVQQRIGWCALGLAIIAIACARRGLAAIALFAACLGLVLYSTDSSAPAALLALLVFAREPGPAAAASASNNPQNTSA